MRRRDTNRDTGEWLNLGGKGAMMRGEYGKGGMFDGEVF